MPNLLVIDVGNTNVVLGIFRDETLLASWRMATTRERTSDEYGVLARELVHSASNDKLVGAIVASVVPPLNGSIAQMVEKYFGVSPLFVEPGIKTGLSILMDNPLEVGADRIVNAVAAYHFYGGPTIVVDLGTATTFDVVSAKGEYRGGIIAPGLTISAEALIARAARLPRVDIRRPAQLIGTNTVTAIQSGVYFGYLGLVDGILARLKAEIPTLKKVVATGGLSSMLVEESEFIDELDPDLTLKGLKILWDRNRVEKKSRR